ncbi:RNA polymerase sigma factor [Oceanihabitans sp. 2_MG-2023]|uniref:RNA polymerase sigma factor n=1 Tax=Oceanihabitans sp. 2_MG-2023 TaxID=3062661 RepID=UPI0026E2A475|nr:RNA polymerase sigma factor [Oceanihabitans sp. 2_MG-2023]MDO6597505.1 RNA polymerase sigma factor [Oceanihabitans sp. 2_MG-2023]
MKPYKHIDAQLVEAFQSGDKEALAKLVKRWHFTFCKKAFWIVKDAELSKDIAQDTWQTIIDKIDTLQDKNSFSSWAFRIVYSKSLDVLRKKNYERCNNEEYAKNQDAIAEDASEDTALKKKVLRAIQGLSTEQQLVVKLFYVEEYGLKEISKTLNISVGTAKSRLFYAREKLRLILKK